MSKGSKKKLSLSAETQKVLIRLLRTIKDSSRFSFFEMVPIMQFLGDRASEYPTIKDLTIGQIADLGEAQVSSLNSLKPSQAKFLIGILKELMLDAAPLGDQTSEDEDQTLHLLISNEKNLAGKTSSRAEQANFGSVEAEKRLNEAADKLRSSQRFPTLAYKKLGEFWLKDWPRAPFEEGLTLKQFSEMKMDMLLKKRSFGPDKIVAVVNAVERALTEKLSDKAGAPKAPTPPSPAVPKKGSKISMLPLSKKSSGWRKPAHAIPSYGYTILSFFDMQRSLAKDVQLVTPSARLIEGLPELLLPDEFLILWFFEDHPLSVISLMFDIPENELAILIKRLRKNVRSLLDSRCTEVSAFWDSALSDEEVPEKLLIEPYVDRTLDREFQKAILRVALASLRA